MAFGSSQYSGEYGYSGEQERRSAVNSGEFRSGQGPPRPPGQWNSQHLEPRGANHRVSGELAPPRPPSQQRQSEHYGPSEFQSSGGGGFAPSYRPRPGEYNSGEYRPRPGEYNSGEYRPRRPGEYSSGEYDSGNESETRAINRGNSGRSDAGSYRYNGRGIP